MIKCQPRIINPSTHIRSQCTGDRNGEPPGGYRPVRCRSPEHGCERKGIFSAARCALGWITCCHIFPVVSPFEWRMKFVFVIGLCITGSHSIQVYFFKQADTLLRVALAFHPTSYKTKGSSPSVRGCGAGSEDACTGSGPRGDGTPRRMLRYG